MSTLKKAAVILSISLFPSSFYFSILHSAEKMNVDPSILQVINGIVTEMQRQTMSSLYAEMPFKEQMRGRMMTERAGQNYMMQVIQPQMMQKNMGAEKLKLMNQMSKF